MEKNISRRIRFTSPQERLVPVGRGFIKLLPGWSGPVKSEVADFAILKGWAVEVFRDGEPPAHDTAPETTPALEVFTHEPADDEPLADFEPEPPRETFEGSE